MDVVPGQSGRQLEGYERQIWRAVTDGGWALLARLNGEFSAKGMSLTDMRVLEVLSEVQYMSISELAASAHLGVSSVSRLITRFIESGDAVRVPSESDARHRLVSLTPQGRQTLARHIELHDRLIRAFVVDVLSTDDFEGIGEAFSRIGRATR